MLAVYPQRNEDISYQQTSRLVTLKWCQKQNAKQDFKKHTNFSTGDEQDAQKIITKKVWTARPNRSEKGNMGPIQEILHTI